MFNIQVIFSIVMSILWEDILLITVSRLELFPNNSLIHYPNLYISAFSTIGVDVLRLCVNKYVYLKTNTLNLSLVKLKLPSYYIIS